MFNDLTDGIDAVHDTIDIVKYFTNTTVPLFILTVLGGVFTPPPDPPPLKITPYSSVRELRKKLNMKDRESGLLIQTEGMFYPGILLNPGWWDKETSDEWDIRISDDRDSIGGWLYHGFESWAPSWECSLKTKTLPDDDRAPDVCAAANNYLLGQLGCEDEGDSILVIVEAEKAKPMRHAFSANKMVMAKPAHIIGSLWHPRQLPREIKSVLNRCLPKGWPKAFRYCLLVRDNEPSHLIFSPDEHSERCVYSGYLWECLCPQAAISKAEAAEEGVVKVEDVYFLWEHTNFANEEAVKFNIDALEAKRAILDRHLGGNVGLKLVQRSAWTVEEFIKEEPLYGIELFQNFMLEKSQKRHAH